MIGCLYRKNVIFYCSLHHHFNLEIAQSSKTLLQKPQTFDFEIVLSHDNGFLTKKMGLLFPLQWLIDMMRLCI